jgi:hypothetical protein
MKPDEAMGKIVYLLAAHGLRITPRSNARKDRRNGACQFHFAPVGRQAKKIGWRLGSAFWLSGNLALLNCEYRLRLSLRLGPG